MLQHRGLLTCLRAPHDSRSVCGAAEQVAATGAEAAAVNSVAMTRQRREGKLRKVCGVINAQGFIDGAGGQQRRREGAAAHLVCVVS